MAFAKLSGALCSLGIHIPHSELEEVDLRNTYVNNPETSSIELLTRLCVVANHLSRSLDVMCSVRVRKFRMILSRLRVSSELKASRI